MNRIIFIAAVMLLTACTTMRMYVPGNFSSQATKMSVSGLNGWMVNQQLGFGPYKTSRIRRGWDFASSASYTRFSMKPEEALLKVFDINTHKATNTQKHHFQYTLEDGDLSAEVFATERFQEKQLKYRSNNPWIGNATKTNRYEYAFTASILPLNTGGEDPWSLVLINKYDINNDSARGLFGRPYVDEEGYASNGKENYAIRALHMKDVTNSAGKKTKLFGGKLLTGYEISKEGRAVVMIDILDNNIWLANNLDAKSRLIVSSISSAILLKRMQDVEKDKDSFDDN